jgi:hypothetical protein
MKRHLIKARIAANPSRQVIFLPSENRVYEIGIS